MSHSSLEKNNRSNCKEHKKLDLSDRIQLLECNGYGTITNKFIETYILTILRYYTVTIFESNYD